MKKLLLLILVLSLTLTTFVACKNDDNPEETSGEPSQSEEESTTGDAEPGEETVLEQAIAYIHQLYKDKKEATQSNYDLVKSVQIGETKCEITWEIIGTDTVKLTENAEKNIVTVNVPEAGSEDVRYTLKASVTVDGQTASKEYSFYVPKFKIFTFAEYAAAADGEAVTIEGIVSGIFSKTTGSSANGLYIQDAKNEGGYYVYNLNDDPNGTIEVGMTVQVKGEKDLYNGTYEIINASVSVLNDGAKTEVTPVDYTDIIKNAEKLTDEALIEKQGMLVTIKGVTVGEVNSDQGYYYFTIGEHKVYLRISTSNNATDKDSLAKIKENFAANYGNTADVTGIISLYSGAFYLAPVSADAFANFQQPERNDQQKAEFELGAIKFDTKITSDKVLELIANGKTYSDVALTWTVEGEGATYADGKLTIKIPDNGSEITIKATAKCGDATATAEWKITLSKSLTPIKDAIALGDAQADKTYTADKYLVGGIIEKIVSDQYGNCYIKDADGNSIYVYGLYSADGSTKYDALETKPQAGDYVVVLGVLGKYNGTVQLKSGWIITHTTSTSIKDANDVANGTGDNNYTSNKYLVTGVIESIVSDKYGNVYIQDSEGNKLYVYGLYDATGVSRYDVLEYKPQVGDTITVLGVLGNYKKKDSTDPATPQMKNAWIVDLAKAEVKVPNISESTGCGMSPDQYFENGESLKNGAAADWLKENRADGIKGVDSIGFRGWAHFGDKTVKAFGYAIDGGDIAWTGEIVDDDAIKPILSNQNVRRYVITIDLKGLAAGTHTVVLYAQDGEDNIYVLDKWGEIKVVVEAKATGLPANLDFTNAANKASGDDFMKENYKDWTITGKLGQTYGGYLGFGRSGDKQSSIKSVAFKTDKAFTVKAVLKGNAGTGSVTTSTLTFSLVDVNGNVVATADAVTPAEGTDTTYEITFTLAEGKTWADVSNLLVSFNKGTGNIGLKSLEFVA